MNYTIGDLEKIYNLAVGLIKSYAVITTDEKSEPELFDSLQANDSVALSDLDELFTEACVIGQGHLQKVAFVISVAERLDEDISPMLFLLFG